MAIITLANFGDKESIPEIRKLLVNDFWHEHTVVKDALRKLGVPDSEIQQAKENK